MGLEQVPSAEQKDSFPRVRCNTTKGVFVAEIHHEWAPLGAQRYLDLVKAGYWDGVSFFRVVPNFIVQFGIAADPKMNQEIHAWGTIKDDPPRKIPFVRGTMSFAGGGDNTRDSQIFVSYADSDHLGKAPWETPFGMVVEGMEALSALYAGYGDLSVFGGNAPDNDRMHIEGAAYIRKDYPLMDYIHSCKVITAADVEKEKKSLRSHDRVDALEEHTGIKTTYDQPTTSAAFQDQELSTGEVQTILTESLLIAANDDARGFKKEAVQSFPFFPVIFFVGLMAAVWFSWKMTRTARRHLTQHKHGRAQ